MTRNSNNKDEHISCSTMDEDDNGTVDTYPPSLSSSSSSFAGDETSMPWSFHDPNFQDSEQSPLRSTVNNGRIQTLPDDESAVVAALTSGVAACPARPHPLEGSGVDLNRAVLLQHLNEADDHDDYRQEPDRPRTIQDRRQHLLDVIESVEQILSEDWEDDAYASFAPEHVLGAGNGYYYQ